MRASVQLLSNAVMCASSNLHVVSMVNSYWRQSMVLIQFNIFIFSTWARKTICPPCWGAFCLKWWLFWWFYCSHNFHRMPLEACDLVASKASFNWDFSASKCATTEVLRTLVMHLILSAFCHTSWLLLQKDTSMKNPYALENFINHVGNSNLKSGMFTL